MNIEEVKLRFILLTLGLLLSFSLPAGAAFEIPRSDTVELEDKSSGRVYPLTIKLPKSYKKNPNKNYPVVYTMDGSYSFQIISGATRYPMNAGFMREAIIVAIGYAKGEAGVASRIRDFTPVYAKSWRRETGQAKAHVEFISSAVFTYIENNYRASKTDRTFVGNSLGGLLGAYIIYNRADMFASYIIGSPSIWFNNNYLLSQPVNAIKKSIKVYISVGALEHPEYGSRYDMVAGAKSLAEILTKANAEKITLKLSLVNGAHHDAAFPTTAIQGLDWIYRIDRGNKKVQK